MAGTDSPAKEMAVEVVDEKHGSSTPGVTTPVEMSKDEHHLATLGYKQVFIRSFGLFENWAATFTTMNFVSGMPVLFGFAMYTGGPQAGFANWCMVGGLSFIVSLAMAEIAASLPTAGGIYYWAYKLGGSKYGPLLSWLTAWYNWAGWLAIIPGIAQGNTNFLVSAFMILYPESTVVSKGWFGWCISTFNILIAIIPNVYDASVHLAEETHSASEVVAKGMWIGTLATWLMSIPTLALIMLCMQDFTSIVNGGYANNWAEYLVQLVGPSGAVAILVCTWLDGLLATAVCILSAQRITYAIARDGVLPFSNTFKQLSHKHHLPVYAALLIGVLSICINAAVIGSIVAFSAITAAATIATNISYLIPILARQTLGRKTFEPAKWNLGRFSSPISAVASCYISFLAVVLMLPQLYPVTADSLNYAPVMIGCITLIALGGWFFPFKLGGRHWFEGPKRTISEADVRAAYVKEEEIM